ncbi:hypothetical protein AQUCO_01300034v1 [Aquilegia coerulea]|uniref:RRM domain-containing protein n=1 Tax=Aquilegia coerulea TaxID=218851 RepID=A0A2G5DZF1_AQUCA|nr:hypothetical protein AQUCO_01300034v1 [Aquilegia coerulea]
MVLLLNQSIQSPRNYKSPPLLPFSLSLSLTRKMPPLTTPPKKLVSSSKIKIIEQNQNQNQIHRINQSSSEISEHNNVFQSESSQPNNLKIVRQTFDLNEPWCDSNEFEIGGVSQSQVKQEGEEEEIEKGIIIEKDLNEIQVKEVENKQVNDKIEQEQEQVPIIREKKKQKEFEVFVGGLDRDAVEEDLEKVFKKIGDVIEVRLVKNKYSQKNKGFAFVRFATIDQAKRAASELNYTQVRGKVCEVTRNNDNETLHLGNICTTWTKNLLVERLRPYELENLEDVHLIEDPKDRRKNRGYAFLNFSTHMDAVAACNKLQKGSLYLGTTVRADIAFAKSAVEPDEEIMAQVKSVFLDGLPPTWDELQVHQQFEKYGEIENVQLARNMPSAKRSDFGFISFRTREAALTCIDAVNQDGIGEGARKVSVKATLRKPLQRRMPSTMGGWRGYSNDNYDSWSIRSSGIGRSYSSRQSRTVESFGRGRGRDRRIGGYDRYATREGVCESELSPEQNYRGYSHYSSRGISETELSPVEEYGSQFRRGSVRQLPTTSRSRSRGPYFESSSSSRRSSRNYEEYPTYSQVSSHGQYDDSYDLQYDYYEDTPSITYDFPTKSRMKRPYAVVSTTKF